MMPALPEIHVGSPMWCEALALHPLYSECPSTLNYLLSYEAMGAGTLVVREVSRDGSVPDLVVENNGSSSVLFLEGTELQGAKQDRMLFQSVLVGANSRIHVPVVCIEHGRWHGISRYFTPGDSIAPRAMPSRAPSGSSSEPDAICRTRAIQHEAAFAKTAFVPQGPDVPGISELVGGFIGGDWP